MPGILERIHQGEVLVADGAMGTLLFQNGLKANECPESFNLSRPEVLENIANQYLKAGADIIQTNSFGGSPLKLAQYGLDEQVEEINIAAVTAVRRTVGDRAYVSGSCGPCGKILIPYGDTLPELVYDGFIKQIRALVKGGVDMICIETMIDINEAVLAVRAAKAEAPTLPIMATMTFDQTPKGFFTIMGTTIDKACPELAKAGADIIGSNCGYGIEMMIKIAKEFRTHCGMPLVIQANAGLPELEDGRPVYRETPEFMAEKAEELIPVGVSVIGGCCGTTPRHIAALRRMVDRQNRSG